MSMLAQDRCKVTPKLTVNMGLRWNYNFRFDEKYGHWANFDLKAIDPTLGIPGTLVFAKNGSDSFEKNEYATNFGPQLGFAYSPGIEWCSVVPLVLFSIRRACRTLTACLRASHPGSGAPIRRIVRLTGMVAIPAFSSLGARAWTRSFCFQWSPLIRGRCA